MKLAEVVVGGTCARGRAGRADAAEMRPLVILRQHAAGGPARHCAGGLAACDKAGAEGGGPGAPRPRASRLVPLWVPHAPWPYASHPRAACPSPCAACPARRPPCPRTLCWRLGPGTLTWHVAKTGRGEGKEGKRTRVAMCPARYHQPRRCAHAGSRSAAGVAVAWRPGRVGARGGSQAPGGHAPQRAAEVRPPAFLVLPDASKHNLTSAVPPLR